MAHIVLAHGILGFGENPLTIGVNYFNGVAAALSNAGHQVFAPTVDALGSLERRSEQLANAITGHWPGTFDLAVIAHSMGGLDVRRVINRHRAAGSRIKHLITIATPHLGSPVADAVLDKTHALRAAIPFWWIDALGENTGALPDLATRTVMQDPDCEGVRYMEVVCKPAGQSWKTSPFFELSRAIGNFAGENDGVVARSSACCQRRAPIAEWPVDHGGAIGWPTDLFGLGTLAAAIAAPAGHIERYLALAERFNN